jgi:hypothetical protein
MNCFVKKAGIPAMGMLFVFLINIGSVFGQDVKIVSMPKYISNCLFSFSRNVNWPESNRSGSFTITIIGSKEVYNEMTSLTQNMKVGKQPIQVRYCNSVGELSGYQQMVFVANWQSPKIRLLLEKISGTSTLVVTETEGMTARGSMINFVSSEGKMKFEISKENLQRNDLLASSMLEKMAL